MVLWYQNYYYLKAEVSLAYMKYFFGLSSVFWVSWQYFNMLLEKVCMQLPESGRVVQHSHDSTPL